MRTQAVLRPAPVARFGQITPCRSGSAGAQPKSSIRPVPRHCSAFDTGAAADLNPCLGFACKCVQMLAGVCPAGPGGAMEVTRTKAVIPTATALITEKTVCQVSDGMRCLTMPWVA